MKHKIGDKVKVRSKEWWNAQPKNSEGSVECGSETFTEAMTEMCGKVVTITDAWGGYYFINNLGWSFTEDMFEDSTSDNAEKPQISTELIKDIAEVIKNHNLGVSISAQDGKLIIEPLKVEEDIPIDTPCMVSNNKESWYLRYYAGNKRCYVDGAKSYDSQGNTDFNYIIQYDKFNPLDIEKSLKHNIVKSE